MADMTPEYAARESLVVATLGVLAFISGMVISSPLLSAAGFAIAAVGMVGICWRMRRTQD